MESWQSLYTFTSSYTNIQHENDKYNTTNRVFMKIGKELKKLVDEIAEVGDYNRIAEKSIISNKKAQQIIIDITSKGGEKTEVTREHFIAINNYYKARYKEFKKAIV